MPEAHGPRQCQVNDGRMALAAAEGPQRGRTDADGAAKSFRASPGADENRTWCIRIMPFPQGFTVARWAATWDLQVMYIASPKLKSCDRNSWTAEPAGLRSCISLLCRGALGDFQQGNGDTTKLAITMRHGMLWSPAHFIAIQIGSARRTLPNHPHGNPPAENQSPACSAVAAGLFGITCHH